MPPPCCIVRALSCKARNIPEIESSIVPRTKQLNNVTLRDVPAPAWMRPPGRNLKSCRMVKKRSSQSEVFQLNAGEHARNAPPCFRDVMFAYALIGIPILGPPHMIRDVVRQLVHRSPSDQINSRPAKYNPISAVRSLIWIKNS